MSSVPDEVFYHKAPALESLRKKDAATISPEHFRACIMELARMVHNLQNKQPQSAALTHQSNIKLLTDKAFLAFEQKHRGKVTSGDLQTVAMFVQELLEVNDGTPSIC